MGVFNAEGCPGNKNVAGGSIVNGSDLGRAFQVRKLQLLQRQ